MGNVARGLVPRFRQSGNQPWLRATVQKARQPGPRFSYLRVPAQAGMSDLYVFVCFECRTNGAKLCGMGEGGVVCHWTGRNTDGGICHWSWSP